MAREVNPNREKAKQLFVEHGGNITNRKISEILGEDEKKVAVWKQRDNWVEKPGIRSNVVQQKKKSKKNVVQQKKKSTSKRQETEPFKDEFELDDIDAELNEKQRLFCLYYVKYFNATLSATKAGYSKETAHVQGSRLLNHAKVKTEIRRLKGLMQEELFIDAMDLLKVYIKVAFADITEYVEFGQKDVEVVGVFGPVKDPTTGDILKKRVSFVDLKDSAEIDGSLISEVKQGKDGVSIKLHDKKWALDKLEKYYDLLPDHHKRRIEEEKLKLEREKFEFEKGNGVNKDAEDWLTALQKVADKRRAQVIADE